MSRSNLLDSPRALHEPLYVERNELSALVPNSVTTYGSESFSESQTPLVVVKPYHTPFFTFLAIFANCVMFVVSIWKNGWHIESMSSNPMLGPSSDTLLSLGAKQASLIRLGQWWRLFAPQYLHGSSIAFMAFLCCNCVSICFLSRSSGTHRAFSTAGMIHLLMNMSGLWSLGRGLESEFGFLRIACIYTVSGLSGVLGSAVFIPEIVGVGASGALYGLVGALLADFALNHKTIQDKWAYFIRLMFSVAFGLALGLLPLVDNYAHSALHSIWFLCCFDRLKRMFFVTSFRIALRILHGHHTVGAQVLRYRL
jgi:membrane associated rhomboid family serine protease